eukprot:c47668_g1_i1 orf=92-274(+)
MFKKKFFQSLTIYFVPIELEDSSIPPKGIQQDLMAWKELVPTLSPGKTYKARAIRSHCFA